MEAFNENFVEKEKGETMRMRMIRTELLANVIFLMMLLACIAGASFGLGRCFLPNTEQERTMADLKIRLENAEKAIKFQEHYQNREDGRVTRLFEMADCRLSTLESHSNSIKNLDECMKNAHEVMLGLVRDVDTLRKRVDVYYPEMVPLGHWGSGAYSITNYVQQSLIGYTNACPPISSIAVVDTNYIAEIRSNPSRFLMEMSDDETQKRIIEFSTPPDVDEHDPYPRNRGVIKQRNKKQENEK